MLVINGFKIKPVLNLFFHMSSILYILVGFFLYKCVFEVVYIYINMDFKERQIDDVTQSIQQLHLSLSIA